MSKYVSISCWPDVRDLLNRLKKEGWSYNDLLVEMAYAYDPETTEEWVEEPITDAEDP